MFRIGLLGFHVVAGCRVCDLAFGCLALTFLRWVLVFGFEFFALGCGVRLLSLSFCRWAFARCQAFRFGHFGRCGQRGRGAEKKCAFHV